MTRYRLPGKFCQRIMEPEQTIQREGATLHRFNLSTSDKPAHKWFNVNDLTPIEETDMNKYAKRDEIVIGDMTAIYDNYTKDKKTGEITTHYLKVNDDENAILTVTASQMRDIPEAEPFCVGQKIKDGYTEKTITEVRFPFYQCKFEVSPTSTSVGWYHHDRIAEMIIEEPETADAKPEPIVEPEATPPETIEKAVYDEMLTKIERLKAELDEHVTAFERMKMERDQMERELKKAKNNTPPIGEVDVIRRERDELREAVKTLADTKKERDQLRSQLALLAQEKPKASESDEFAIVTGETAAGMAKRKKQGFTPLHIQFESGKLNVVYQRDTHAAQLPANAYTSITIPTRQPDYATALNNTATSAEDLTAIGNARIYAAGFDAWKGNNS